MISALDSGIKVTDYRGYSQFSVIDATTEEIMQEREAEDEKQNEEQSVEDSEMKEENAPQ